VASNNLGGMLNAEITGSYFSYLLVEQDGCCPADVVMDNDTISGFVTVEEGVSNGDIISLTNSTAGATTFIQGYGPTMTDPNNAQWTGAGDLVNVQDDGTPDTPTKAGTGIFDLAITQLGTGGTGGGQQILVGTLSPVEVALTGFGIQAVQDDSPVPPPPPPTRKSSPAPSSQCDPYRIDHCLWPSDRQLRPGGPAQHLHISGR